ncbi:asparagine synthase (glutamine-hydrolyzing) [soil metagenome]
MTFSTQENASVNTEGDSRTAIFGGNAQFSDSPTAGSTGQSNSTEAQWRRLFGQHGIQAPSKVFGDFSVGFVDAEGRVFLAVDRFGVRSMCYRISDGQLLFAERADELSPERGIEPQAIFDYLYFHNIPSPRTIFKDVFRVPPGHCVCFERGVLSVTRYWQAEFREIRQPSFEPLAQEFRLLLDKAVRTQIDAHQGQSVACFLSGGTDSSTIAGVLGKVSGQRAKTYSIGFDARGYDEMEFARIAARHFDTDHHEYYVTPADLIASIPSVAAHFDQPFGNSSTLPAYYCAKRAKEDGIEMMLGGDGGDELFGGNSRYAKQRVFGWYDALPPMVRKNVLEPILALPGVDKWALTRKGLSYVEQARVPLPDRAQMYNLILRLGTDEVLTADFLARVDVNDPLRQQREVWAQVTAGAPIDRMLAFDWRYTLAENDLPKVCGATSLAHMAVGFPFLDHSLVDFSTRLPADYKLKGLKLRWFFKEALRGFLPDEIIAKKKQGFGLPFGVWAVNDNGLRQLSAESLGALRSRNIVRGEFIDRLMRDLLPAHPGYYGEMVWILMMLEQWLQQHAPGFRV